MNQSEVTLLRRALSSTCHNLPNELQAVPLQFWNESVFRYFLVRELRLLAPELKCWSEWNRIDLVLLGDAGSTLIEIKFFTHRDREDLAGKVLARKGGPSPHNYFEFQKSLKTLADATKSKWVQHCGGVSSAFFVLVYIDPICLQKRRTYDSFYGNIACGDLITNIEILAERISLAQDHQMTCKLLTVQTCDVTNPPSPDHPSQAPSAPS
jgi:hypothetical protein